MSYKVNGVDVIDENKDGFFDSATLSAADSFVGVALPPPTAFGSVSGYTSGGYSSAGLKDIIDKFPFASDGNATDVGDLTQGRYGAAGQQV